MQQDGHMQHLIMIEQNGRDTRLTNLTRDERHTEVAEEQQKWEMS